MNDPSSSEAAVADNAAPFENIVRMENVQKYFGAIQALREVCHPYRPQ